MFCPVQGAEGAKGMHGSTSHPSLYQGTCPHHVAAPGALRLINHDLQLQGNLPALGRRRFSASVGDAEAWVLQRV